MHSLLPSIATTVFLWQVIKDDSWLEGDFVKTVQQRGAEIIKLRGLSSAMSAASSACDHINSWVNGTPGGVQYRTWTVLLRYLW